MHARTVSRAAAALFAFAAAAAFAQTDIATDEDALFGGDEIVSEAPAAQAGSATDDFLKADKVRVGGDFSGGVQAENTWSNPWKEGFDATDADESALSTELSGFFFVDARPDEDYRAYASFMTSWPFSTEVAGGVTIPNISVFELFADWSWNDAVFFRFGKSTVKWGVGYFWSPADVVNLTAIDVMDPTARREGPVSFRVHYPVPKTQHNLYAYAIVDQATMNAADTAVALKAEFLAGNYEIGLGGFYKRTRPERAMLTVTGPLFGTGVDLFAEASLARGSDKQFVKSISGSLPVPAIATETYDDRAFFSGTIGGSYANSDLKLSVSGQYYFNGEGYSDAEREAIVDDVLGLSVPSGAALGMMAPFVAGSGRHYAALSVSRSDFFHKKLSASVFGVANLTDLSATVKPSISWSPMDRMSFTAYAAFALGEAYSEYLALNGGPAVTLGISASLGSGNF